MANITGIISTQAFELIRDRIGAILADEIAGQYVLTADDDINADVYLERSNPFDKEDTPAVNVSFSGGNYSNEHQGDSVGVYTYDVDVYTKASSSDSVGGDVASMLKVHKLAGICRAIIRDQYYKTLAFTPPFIRRVTVKDVNIAQMDSGDAANIAQSRLTIEVTVNETTELLDTVLIGEFVTQVKLNETDKGFIYETI